MKGRQQKTVAAGMKMIYYFTKQSLQEAIWADSNSSDVGQFCPVGSPCENGKSLGTEMILKLMSVFTLCC